MSGAVGGAAQQPAAAVIDIGSNSVRLVMYDGPARAPTAIFNEKVLCGLGDRDPQTGALRPEARAEALATLERFFAVLSSVRPKTVDVVATAGARDAADGQEFLDAVAQIGLTPRLLSGEEEAELAAVGIVAGLARGFEGQGLAGDIGGGSLELCEIAPPKPDEGRARLGRRVSLPLGGLRLSTDYDGDREGARARVREVLAGVPWLSESEPTTLFAVGGAWRALARISMTLRDYPLDILDQYTLTKVQTLDLCRFVSSQSRDSLEGIAQVQRRRVPTLPFAAIVLEEVFEAAKLRRLCISSNGVREGVLHRRLGHVAQGEDPVIALAEVTAANMGAGFSIDRLTMARFSAPVIAQMPPGADYLCALATTLGGAASRFHPEERSRLAAQSVMAMPFRGLSHADRVKVAIALFHRHGARGRLSSLVPLSLVTPEEEEAARLFGLLLRFVAEFDPKATGALPDCRLEVGNQELMLHLGTTAQGYWGRGPEKRFGRVAAALALDPRVIFADAG